MKLRVAESGFLGLVKPDSAPRRLWRSDELLDRFEDGGEVTRSLPIARPFPKRTMQSIQRRPRTSCCANARLEISSRSLKPSYLYDGRPARAYRDSDSWEPAAQSRIIACADEIAGFEARDL